MKKILMYILLAICTSCGKYLDEKPDKKMQVPSTASDMWAILDLNEVMNRSSPWAGEASADDYYLLPQDFRTISDYQKNLYTWNSPSISDNMPNNWADVYKVVYYANVVLDELPKIDGLDPDAKDAIRGSALLFRSKSFLEAMWIWAEAYDQQTTGTALGIPLRLTSDINAPTVRASVEECYKQIHKDLLEAVSLLPAMPEHPMRPSKSAAYGLLTRTALSMRDYASAAEYANEALKIKDNLMHFEELNPSASYPVQRFNKEVIMHFRCSASYSSRMKIDSNLYDSYEDTDLRKKVFFRANADGTYNFKGSYDNTFYLFSGITVSEMLITRAECFARLQRNDEALADLNRLRKFRFMEKDYHPIAMDNELLTKILLERRKELLLRGIRFMDIKRLNKEGRQIIPKRNIDNQQFELPPNSPRYALSIPQIIIDITQIPQN